MRTLILGLAAATFFAAPAVAQPNGNAYGQGPRVCLVTFESEAAATAGADAGVTKAQYLPLAIAQRFEARNDATANIFTYGATGYQGPEIDFHVAAPSDPALGITADMNTQQVCEILADYGDSRDDADDEDADD